MKRRLLGIAAVLLFLCACAAPVPSRSNTPYQLYFTSTLDHGPSIVSQPYDADESPTPEELIQALLSGPSQEGLRSPFPQGLTLRRCTRDETHLTVDFSEQYSGLTDISLTLADYCVVLTVCQLEGIDSVEITVSGRPLNYRSHQILTQEEALPATYDQSP